MNKISAVICELNPQHTGHAYLFEKAREDSSCLIAIMSGNFVQRGECAIFDKYKRAVSAVNAGADLVVELPFPWSSSSAAYFAQAGVHLAKLLGCSHLYFGSETGDQAALQLAARVLNSSEFQTRFCNAGQAGVRREQLLAELCPQLPAALLNSSNDILGAEYCRFLDHIVPVPIQRIDCTGASALRASMIEKIRQTGENPEGAVLFDRLAVLLFQYLRCADKPPEGYAEGSGGVVRRLYKTAQEAVSGADLFQRAATKQYTNARLRRAALFACTGTTVDMLREMPAFTRVLAANENGRAFLASIRRKACGVQVVTNSRDRSRLSEKELAQYQHAGRADSIYTLCMEPVHPAGWFATMNPIML